MHSRLLLLKPFARAIDAVFASVVITPLVVIYWISAWCLCDIFIKPEEPEASAVISFAIGLVGQFVLCFYQSTIAKLLNFEKWRLMDFIASKLYALFAALICINLWRGLWMFADSVSSDDVVSMTRNVVQVLAILILTRTLKNSVASPFVVMTDSNSDYRVSTYFNTTVSYSRTAINNFNWVYNLRKPMEVSSSCSTAFSRTSSICWWSLCGVTFGLRLIYISTPMTRSGQITDRWYDCLL